MNPKKTAGTPALSDAHSAHLEASGLSAETIARAGIHTEADPAALARHLNWKSPAKIGPAIVFPYFDAEGERLPYHRLRPDSPLKNRKYEAPKDIPFRLYFPPGIASILSDASVPLYVSEGEKKALKATQEGVPCIGLPGVACWSAPRPKVNGKSEGERILHSAFDAVKLSGRTVYIVFDSDAVRKPDVEREERLLAAALEAAGAAVKVIRLPEMGAQKKGLDDFLTVDGVEAFRRLVDAAESSKQASGTQSGGMHFVTIADVEQRSINWLWRGWLPRGMVTMVAGDPGIGKTFATIDIAARLSRGDAMPLGGERPDAADALFVAMEDPLAEVVKPRLKAARANEARIHYLRCDGHFSVEKDMGVIVAEAERRKAGLIVFDPLLAYADQGTDTHKYAETVRMMVALRQLAETTGCAVIGVSHLTKAQGSTAMNRMNGSTAIGGGMRSGWLVSKDPNDPDKRVLAMMKTNLGISMPSMSFTIQAAGESATVEWLGKSDLGADELVNQPVAGVDSKVRQAKEELQELLADGPKDAEDAKSAVMDAVGCSAKTVRRAIKQLGIKPTKDGMDGPWRWGLPEEGHSTDGCPPSGGLTLFSEE